MASIQLTSIEEIEELLSQDGVANHTEDLDINHEAMTRIIDQATEECLLYLRSQYAEENLVNHAWVRMQATYIATYRLSIRRGNPSLYTDAYAQALINLEQVRDGFLDPGIPAKARAVVQTPMLDSRFYHPKRVNTAASSRTLPSQRHPRWPWG